jgi:hypothetical protein
MIRILPMRYLGRVIEDMGGYFCDIEIFAPDKTCQLQAKVNLIAWYLKVPPYCVQREYRGRRFFAVVLFVSPVS